MPTMNNLVSLSRDADVAVITIDNPPVNALSSAVVAGLISAVDQAIKDPNIKAVVLIGAGATFVAGADIAEFAKKVSGEIPVGDGWDSLLLPIEDCPKPVVAAIHGAAFGGGLELAMAAHYRVAVPIAKVGQPEVKLGIIPGAGGTQRLPRLAGVAKAIEMCVSGAPISAQDALKCGIIDRLIDADLRGGAILFAREIQAAPLRKTRERNDKLTLPNQDASLFANARDTARNKQRGQFAPLAAIDAIEAATQLPFSEGREVERRLFEKCLFSDQSKALIHVFFAEREANKIPDIPKNCPTLPIRSVGVVGAGTMGCGISMVFANAGIPVLLKDLDQAALDRGLSTIRKNYTASVKRGRLTEHEVEERLKLIRPTLSYDEFSTVELVVEAAFEGMAVKKNVFRELDQVCKPQTILATNTSSLDVDEIADSTTRREWVLGMHFFSPANIMRLVELVRGKATNKEVIATCMQLAKKLGKVAVLAQNCFGFIGNRMYLPYIQEAQFLVEEGTPPGTVDKALYDFGMAMGPLATGDMAGLDVAWRIRQESRHLEKEGIRQPFAEDRLCEIGRFGQKTGAGWYNYDDSRRASPDPGVIEMVARAALRAGISQREASHEEIVDRCILRLVNEGAGILEEGIALRAGDIDTAYVNGYGFPARRGGPMWYADTLGLAAVYERISDFHAQHGALWEPAPLLKRLAERGGTFVADGGNHSQ